MCLTRSLLDTAPSALLKKRIFWVVKHIFWVVKLIFWVVKLIFWVVKTVFSFREKFRFFREKKIYWKMCRIHRVKSMRSTVGRYIFIILSRFLWFFFFFYNSVFIMITFRLFINGNKILCARHQGVIFYRTGNQNIQQVIYMRGSRRKYILITFLVANKYNE